MGRIRGNVCLEVYLPSRGTCLLQHVNLGACKIGDLQGAFAEGMSDLCELHSKTGIDSSGEYLPSQTDRQVGLGVLGLANLLRQNNVTYAQFGEALAATNDGIPGLGTAGLIAGELYKGIQSAAVIARRYNMERAFAIAPPIARSVDRDSGTFGVQTYEYGDVEIASEVGWAAYKKVTDELMYMFNHTGLLHGYSFNSWSDVVTTKASWKSGWIAPKHHFIIPYR